MQWMRRQGREQMPVVAAGSDREEASGRGLVHRPEDTSG